MADSRLVMRGVYRWMRHPLYTSLMCLGLAWACYWRSGPTLFGTLLLAVFLRGKAQREERWLGQQFPNYPQYARQVRRFIPFLW
jgi:protein-S-isoprenylcysteine O-methyltransferase Ste14